MFEWLWQTLAEIQYGNPHLLKAMLAGTLVSTSCGVIGCFIVLRRSAFLADALAHAMLAGVVCGYLFMKLVFGVDAHAHAMLLGSLLAGLLTVVMVGFVSRSTRIKEDAVIGIMYTGVFAAGGVLLSYFSEYVHIDLAHFLTGQLLAVQDADLWMMAAVSSLVLAFVVLLFRPLQLISFDPVMAASIGIPVGLLSYALTACTSMVVVAGVNIVGVILVVGLLIIPAATAYLLCDRLSRMLIIAAALGWTSFLLGYVAAEWLNVAPGSAVVVASFLQFAAVFLLAPRYGILADWRRRRAAVPQHLVEDVLGCISRSPDQRASLTQLRTYVQARANDLQRAVKTLIKEDLLRPEAGQLALTASGQNEASRLLRAHRLWETYLQTVGVDQTQLHARAHDLEHVHDATALEYLDDKLGHPLRDPHGAVIPADPVRHAEGAQLTIALLRDGDQAEVIEIHGPQLTSLGVGQRIEVGPREQQDHIWTVRPAGASDWTRLDHHAADHIEVKLLHPGKRGEQ